MENRIRAIRIELNLTQQELADKIGMHRPNLVYIERGDVTPGGETMLKICKALDRPVQEIFLDFM